MLPWLRARRLVIGLAGSFFLAGAFSVSAWLAAHDVLSDRAEEFRGRCLLYAATVADTVPTWADAAETPDLRPLEQYAAMSGLLYVQVVSGGRVLLERAGFPGAETILAEPPGPPWPRAEVRVANGRHLVDVAVRYGTLPLLEGGSSFTPYATGTLRLGIDASTLAWAATNTQALAGGLAALAWVASSAGLALTLRAMRRVAPSGTEAVRPGPTGARVVTAGCPTLYVDEARLVAAGKSLRLTPKQLDLLKVLMSDPGRTFGVEEILSQAWPSSSYADWKDVKQYVYLIRQRLDGAGLPGVRIIANIPGVGYRIDPAVGPIETPIDSPTTDTRPEDNP